MTPPSAIPRSLWITLEAEEVIEVKRIKQDYDEDGALTFFREVVAPRVRAAAQKHGLALDLFDADCPSIPAGAQLPLALVNGEVVSSGGKISVPAIRRKVEECTAIHHP